MKKQFWNYGIDALLLVGFLVAFFLDLTGLDGHQLLGAAVFIFSAYHLILHWDWVKSVTQRLFSKAAPLARPFYLLDAILLVGLFLITETGIVISSWLNLELVNYTLWLDFHILVSIVTLIALVLKIALHWKWIVSTTRRVFARPQISLQQPGSPRLQPVPVKVNSSRREFIGLMGVVGAASVIAAANGLQSLTSAQSEVAPSSQASTTTSPTTPSRSTTSGKSGSSLQTLPNSSSQSSSSSSTACRIRCNKGCSYPGRCQRYVDANGNKKCDLGECL